MSKKIKETKVAYFCMEYGLDENLPIYAGGLGILAGDVLKAAKENEYPLIGIGLLWRQGYTNQIIGDDDRPVDTYPRNDHIYDLAEDTGKEITVSIKNKEVICKIYKLDCYDNSELYLLDTNHPDNDGEAKWITGQLYGWFSEERIAQEIVLGIGGIKAMRELDLDIDVYHFNEGHAALAATELIKEKRAKGATFEEALEDVREEVVFTTHTPVPQGNEEHSLKTLEYMGAFNGLTIDQMVRIGGAPFNMTVAGLRLSSVANGVAQLHGETANKMWEDVDDRAPIKAITNGVHLNTWVDQRMIDAYKDKGDLWSTHQEIKSELIDFVADKTGTELDEDKLLIGFARRAAPYKRADLIFSDLEKIRPYFEKGEIQIIFSGKAHPLDDTGKELVEILVEMTKEFPDSVVFLEDYDMEIGRMLTRGVDVWLNNPRRPKEASGTSGMKAAMNGILNVSILDGWWPEACEHGVNGWQFGDAFESEDVEEQDKHDLEALYEVLLEEVLPTYYDKKDKWKKMMRESIASTLERFNAKVMIENYYQMMYSKKVRKNADRKY
ncbi:alpha-glucan family phosphorylase [Halanaerobiaceae bacterium Z-7014]|uniref:glycogen phosphorylase n=1 Tax=Halonatronomonas betaini TaxID=2778430 RepID=A0A931F805_9FIRM|nr:alpha-glucan family phosphorylase [Halonatronomonas betaini]MBF8437231.1 alpha-glucan family phosphorylase [Halonatronomonas betaini]